MTKIMLVEDDKSLREIYSIRLVAEGYEVVSAGDGEEALALAVQQKPDLVISDVMMPKISGFDMLDILRQTPETKDIKVIMMTALSSEDQRERGNALGANRYLVKSQVGIEDVVNAIHDVLADTGAIEQQDVSAQAAQTEAMPANMPTNLPENPVEAAPIAAAATVVSEAPQMAQTITETINPTQIAQPITQPVAQPIAQPMAQPAPQPAAQPAPQSVVQPEMQPAAQPMAQPTEQPAVQPIIQPFPTQPDVQATFQAPVPQFTPQDNSQVSQN